MNLAVKVSRREAEAFRKMLLRAGVLDQTRAIVEKEGMVEIPVTKKTVQGAEYVYQENPVYRSQRLSLEGVKRSLREVIGRKADHLRGWELLGDVVVVSLPLETDAEKRETGKSLLRFFPRAMTVVNRKGIHDIFRQPEVEVLYGDGTHTVHKENGCRFVMDVSKVMFSAGNMEERRRMAYVSNRNEVVLDMFAGIGQFTIPMAKHSRPRKVIAIEKNPVAHGFLWENVKINKLDNVDAILGDCREKSPMGAVDRVVMGYLFDTHAFLPHAFRALRGAGIIHFHSLVRRRDERAVESAIKKKASSEGFTATRIKRRKVKSYSPGYHHVVFDVDVERWKS